MVNPSKALQKRNEIFSYLYPSPSGVSDGITNSTNLKSMYLNKYDGINIDTVRVCNDNFCVEASGDNARLITGALVFALVCIGIAALVKA